MFEIRLRIYGTTMTWPSWKVVAVTPLVHVDVQLASSQYSAVSKHANLNRFFLCFILQKLYYIISLCESLF